MKSPDPSRPGARERGTELGDDHDHQSGPGHGSDDAEPGQGGHGGHEHDEGLLSRLRHTLWHSHAPHERVDRAMETHERGIWALKISIAGLGATALLQVVIVALSGSVALLADTLHNFADAGTALPLWLAFAMARRPANRRFTYGYGRAEDLAGLVIVMVIFATACVAGYESIQRLLDPEPMTHIWWVAAAAIIGFIGNEAVAVLRIRVGREIGSAALVADGQHSRVDGFTSLAVLGGAAGTWLGYPVLDPLIGLGITVAILFIVWEAGRSVLLRVLDGIDPAVLADIEAAALAVAPEVESVGRVRARYVGHKIWAEVNVAVRPGLPVEAAHEIAHRVEAGLRERVPGLSEAQVHVSPAMELPRV